MRNLKDKMLFHYLSGNCICFIVTDDEYLIFANHLHCLRVNLNFGNISANDWFCCENISANRERISRNANKKIKKERLRAKEYYDLYAFGKWF